MTLEERKALAHAEILETIQWLDDETSRIFEELNEKQGSDRKFDGGNKPYAEAHKEFARRMTAIGEKYGLLPSTKKTAP